jgi:hypothetical protein
MMMTTITKILLGSLLAALFIGCKPATKAGVRSNTTLSTSGLRTDQNGQVTFQTNCAPSIGSIYSYNMNAHTFETQVKAFLSATTNPNDIGTVSSLPANSTGVQMSGLIFLDKSGQVDVSQSKISVQVYDSFVSQGLGVIKVEIAGASSGSFNLQTGIGSVVFKDQHGEIKFDGRLGADTFDGDVTFKNYKTVVSGANPSSGTLGQFNIKICGFIQ